MVVMVVMRVKKIRLLLVHLKSLSKVKDGKVKFKRF